MKPAEEYIKQYTRYDGVFGMNTHPLERTDMKSMIDQVQKDAYNEALEDAINCNSDLGETFTLQMFKQSISNLKKT